MCRQSPHIIPYHWKTYVGFHWDLSSDTFLNSPDLPSHMGNLKTFFVNLPLLPVADLIAHRSLGAKGERAWSNTLIQVLVTIETNT